MRRRRKTSTALSIITKNNTEEEKTPWQDMLESNAHASRRIALRNEQIHDSVQECTCITVDCTILDPLEILLTLENAGLYDVTEERRRYSLQL